MIPIEIDEHPLLDAEVVLSTFDKPINSLPSPPAIIELLKLETSGDVPLVFDETIKPIVRNLLRHGGYKPTGRGKPASEYLRQADAKGALNPINLPVDVCNVVSLHSGLPISVVDLDRLETPLRIGIAPPNSEYVFNATGQTIKIDGLLCLFDAMGPCANGVKDSQRTKTNDETSRTVSIIWGTKDLPGRTADTARWYQELLNLAGVEVKMNDA